MKEEFHRAQGQVTAEDIKSAIPITFPRTGAIDPIRFPGVSKFDATKWEAEGKHYLSKAGWIALTQIIANKDPVNLAALWTTAENLKSSL